MLDEKPKIYLVFSSHIDRQAARVVTEPQTDRRQPASRDSHRALRHCRVAWNAAGAFADVLSSIG
jgi:hypothetical protein